MQQAINELSPYMTRFRGIDGFWQGQVATSQVPRPVVLGLLGKVNQTNQDERLKVDPLADPGRVVPRGPGRRSTAS